VDLSASVFNLERDDTMTRLLPALLLAVLILCPLAAFAEDKAPSDSCVAVCKKCAKECETCAKCCKDDGRPECARMCETCHRMCLVCAQLTGGKSPLALDACVLCEKVCKECEKECKKHDADCCKECAKVCKECAQACADSRK
jgi:hypothetical protein